MFKQNTKSVIQLAFVSLSVTTRSSAIEEGPRDVLVSRNPATTKHLISKLEPRTYRVALFA